MTSAPPAHPPASCTASADLSCEMRGPVAIVRLTRPAKRNALNDGLILALKRCFEALPRSAKAAVLAGEGEHFCAGLDLSELSERDAVQGLAHSRMWHQALDAIQYGPVPVVAALHGAVVGGGLELACSAHIRVSDETAFYALPEGTRGIFVGGGGSVRIPKLIGVAAMSDMMLTGRVLSAADAERRGLVQYLEPAGQALTKALALAERIAQNAPTTNFAIAQVLPRIAEQPSDHGYMTEALISSIAQSAPEAKARVQAFLAGQADKVKKAG